MKLTSIGLNESMLKKKARTAKIGKQVRTSAAVIIKALEIPFGMSENVNPKPYRDIAKAPTESFWDGTNSASKQFWQWLKQNGVESPLGQIPKFAEGGDGRAYFVGKHVVKFTRDRAGANIANMCIGVQNAPAPVIAVWRVPAIPLWAILQWRVHPEKVPAEIKLAADYLTAWIDENPGMESFPTDQDAQTIEAKKLLTKLGGPLKLIPSVVLVMNVHNKLYFSTGFSHTDGGPTNISMRKGTGEVDDEVVYHDLGPNMGSNYKPREVLDQIHTTRKKLNLPDVDEV